MTDTPPPVIGIVVPVYNEAAVLPEFHRRLAAVMQGCALPWHVIYVDDGSSDGSAAAVQRLRAADPHVGLLRLSRNFGKEAATTAGLDTCAGDAVIVIDADLQDPPEVIPELLAGWREGFDMVYAQRRRRDGETAMKRLTAHLFYRLMHRVSQIEVPPDTGDFRLMSRRHLDALLRLRERNRFMKGLFAWVGFPSKPVPYDRAPRHAGRTKFNYWRLWEFALDGITSFTVMPLKVATFIGLIAALLAVLLAAYIFVKTLVHGNPVAGYPSLMVAVLFLGGAQLITLGVIGEYLGRIFHETKARPLYVVDTYLPPT